MPSLSSPSNKDILGMRHSAPTRLCAFALWLNCGVLAHVYCPSPGVQYPDGGMGFVFLGIGRRILVVYDIMGHEGALNVPPSGAFLVLVECVVELCVMLVLVYSLSL